MAGPQVTGPPHFQAVAARADLRDLVQDLVRVQVFGAEGFRVLGFKV